MKLPSLLTHKFANWELAYCDRPQLVETLDKTLYENSSKLIITRTSSNSSYYVYIRNENEIRKDEIEHTEEVLHVVLKNINQRFCFIRNTVTKEVKSVEDFLKILDQV